MKRRNVARNRAWLSAVSALVFAAMAISVQAEEKSVRTDLGIFQRFDTDMNGVVTQAEFDAARSKQLSRFDANRDGLVSVDEIDALLSDRLARRGKGAGAARSQASVLKADANRDGFISFDEFAVTGNAVFASGDANRDGVLSALEAQALEAAPMRKQ